jgi:Spy/CpxP family protein refolding chaperone
MKRLWFIILALSLGLNAGLLFVAFSGRGQERGFFAGRNQEREHAGPRRPEGGRRGGRHVDPDQLSHRHVARMTRHLGLDKNQREAMAEILGSYMPRILAQQQRLNGIRMRIGTHYSATEMNPAEFRNLVQELNEEQTRLDSLVMESMLAEAAFLTPEQRGKYARTLPWERPMGPPRGRRR